MENLNEVRLEPVVILDGVWYLLFLTPDLHRGMTHVWELSRRMISPDDDVTNFLGVDADTRPDLPQHNKTPPLITPRLCSIVRKRCMFGKNPFNTK